MNRTLRNGLKTFCIGFPRDFPPRETSPSESCDTQPTSDTLQNSHSILVVASSSFCDVALFRLFILVVHQPCNAEKDTCLWPYHPFNLYRIGTWADANFHKTFACRYLSKNIYTVVEWTHGYDCATCNLSPLAILTFLNSGHLSTPL